jgi:hypothetical protein
MSLTKPEEDRELDSELENQLVVLLLIQDYLFK